MSKLKEFQREGGGKIYMFYCPGCRGMHHFNVDKPNQIGALWTFDGNMETPTFAPSLGVSMGRPDDRCHSFVRNGRIEYLGDCHHSLAGQTVNMVDMESVTDA